VILEGHAHDVPPARLEFAVAERRNAIDEAVGEIELVCEFVDDEVVSGFWVFSDLGEAVNSLAFSPDGKLLAAACMDGKLRLFDGRTGEFKKVWDDDSGRWWVVFSPDGKTLVSQSGDKTVKIWDVETAKVRRTLQGNKASVMAAAFSPEGKLFATGGIVRENDKVTGGEVILWDAQTGDLKHTLPDQALPSFDAVLLSRRQDPGRRRRHQRRRQRRREDHGRNQTVLAGVAGHKKVADEDRPGVQAS
jgi:WD40 repeat protein